jgi:hypothetical protein
VASIQNLLSDFKARFSYTDNIAPGLDTLVQYGAETASVKFSASATSATFAITNRLAMIQIPAISGAPTLTLQVSLDAGTTWADTSVSVASSATVSKLIEADALARVSGAFGLANAFRLSSGSSITATLLVRSIAQ